MRILIAEDDPRLVRMLVAGLEEERFVIEVTTTGSAALLALTKSLCDACILDVNLPELDGFSVLQKARAQGIKVPVLILTARDSVPDRVHGLDLGADDYLVKPFAFAELLARLHALLRRGTGERDGKLRVGHVELDSLIRKVTVAGKHVDMSPKQYALLEYLMRHAGKVVARTTLLHNVWGYGFELGTNVIDVHISELRRRLDRPGEPSFIRTIRCVGYIVGHAPVA